MKKILVFGASNSKNSINKKFASYTAGLLEGVEIDLIDLNDFEMPIYSIDREKESGIPQAAHNFKEKIKACDAVIASFAEHNGSYTVAFKNILDWTSRIDKVFWYDKPILALSASPGGRGGKTVLEAAVAKMGFMNGVVTGSFSLPRFFENFSESEGILDEELNSYFKEQLNSFQQAISEIPTP